MKWEKWIPFLVAWIIVGLAVEAEGKIKVKDTRKEAHLQRVKRAIKETVKTVVERGKHQKVRSQNSHLARFKRGNQNDVGPSLDGVIRNKRHLDQESHKMLKHKVDEHALHRIKRQQLAQRVPLLQRAKRDMTEKELQRMKRNKRNMKDKRLRRQRREKRNYIHDKRIKGELQKLKSGGHRVKRRQEHHVDENINAHQYHVKLNKRKKMRSHPLSESKTHGWVHSKRSKGNHFGYSAPKQHHHSKKAMDLVHVPLPVMKKNSLSTHDHRQLAHNMKTMKKSNVNLQREKKNGHAQHIKTVDDFKQDLQELKRLHHTLDKDMEQIAQLKEINKAKRAKRKAQREKHHQKA